MYIQMIIHIERNRGETSRMIKTEYVEIEKEYSERKRELVQTKEEYTETDERTHIYIEREREKEREIQRGGIGT
tara:strand:+ start:291 stop:512 length:222 start_codon:yes stop_codon:yes gene_type:complete